MKRILFLLTLTGFLSVNVFGQAIPKQINYQGILKEGSALLDGNYPFTFRIYNDPTGGSALWTESQTITVENGLFSAHLGSVTPIAGVPFNRVHFLGITIGTGSELAPRTMLTPSAYSFMSMDIMDNAVSTIKLQDAAVTSSKIGSNQVVKSINGLKDDVTFVAGTNITLTPSGNNITINAAGGGGGSVTQVNTGPGLTGGPITTTGTISVTNDGITNAMLQNNSVTSAKIIDGTIVTADLGDNSVTSAKIVDGTIAAADLANNSVTSAKILDGTIVTADLGDNSVTSAKIVDGSILNADINSSAGISVFKILGDVGFEFRTWGSSFYGVPVNSSTVIDMGSISLTAPTSGHVVVWLSGYATFFGDRKTIAVGINTNNTSINEDASVDIGRLDGTGTLRFTEPFNAMGVFVISAGGNYNFYALVQGNTTFGAVSANVIPQTMTAIFIPKRY